MPDAHANFAASTVATAPSPASSGTSLVVATGDGAKFPAAPFNAPVCPAATQPTTTNAEIVRVTNVTGDTLTIVRQQEGTSARTIVVGDQIFAGITAKTLTDVEGFATTAVSGIYGDGSDGNVTISTTVTLTRDMYYDTLTINSPGVLKAAAFRVNFKTALVVNSGATLQFDGNAASAATAGAAVSAGGTLGSLAGANGGTGTGAASGSGAVGTLGGRGGTGGTGGSGGAAAAGNVFAFGASFGGTTPHALMYLATGDVVGSATTVQPIGGGTGGSAGAGDATNSGGGGGAGGGVLLLNAKTVTNSGTISANGGNGGNPATGNCGGGGGGGGGVVILNTSQAITGSAPTATGGTGGTKTGTGTNGATGSAGNVFVNVWS